MKKASKIIGLIIEAIALIMTYFAIWNASIDNVMRWFFTVIITIMVGILVFWIDNLNK